MIRSLVFQSFTDDQIYSSKRKLDTDCTGNCVIHIEEKEMLPPGSWPSFEGEIV